MSFVKSTATPSAPVATNGTLVFSYPAIAASGLRIDQNPFDTKTVASAAPQALEQTSSGDFKFSMQHYAYSVGLQAKLLYGRDFTLSFSDTVSSGVTMTYLGATSLPAGAPVLLQLNMAGQDDGNVFADDTRRARLNLAPVAVARFGTPIASTATNILSAVADAGTTLVALATPFVLDTPRNLIVKSSTTDTSQVTTIRGFDEFGVAMTESFTMNGTSSVVGKKAWKTVVSYQCNIALAGNLSIGVGLLLGMPFCLPTVANAFAEGVNGAKPTAGAFVAADASVPTATTGDVRGTYSPNTAPDAAHQYEVYCIVPDPQFLGLPQFAG